MIASLRKLANEKGLSDEERNALQKNDWETHISLDYKVNQFPLAYQTVKNFQSHIGLEKDQMLLLIWQLWLPLALTIIHKKQQNSFPIIQGILGLQGTGKTTLAKILQSLLTAFGYHTINLSLDDLYKTYRERQQLQNDDPRLIWRGPPVTHDVNLGIELLDQIHQGKTPVAVPRFDKSAVGGMGDRAAESEMINDPIDIVLFEGWFLGVSPVPETAFDSPPDPIRTEQDRQFAIDNNRRLSHYLPLWERLDGLIILTPEDYQLSQQWRREAEQKMIAHGKSGMSDQQINQFVEYFWRSLHPQLFMTPLMETKEGVDVVVELDAHHVPKRID